MGVRVSILSSDDTIWALPCWDRTLAHLAAEGVQVEEFIVTTFHPSIGRTKETAMRWYMKRFGPMNFAGMAAFALLSKLAARMTGAPRSYAALCRKHGVVLRRFASVKDPGLLAHFQQHPPGIVAIMVPEIIPASLIAQCPGGMINQHPSLLPKYRGLFPYLRAAAARDEQGVTLHRIDAGIDEGDILYQYRFSPQEAATMLRAHATMMWRYPAALLAALRAAADPAHATRLTTGHEESQYFSTPDAAAMQAFFAAGGKVAALRDFALAWRNGSAR